MRARPSIPLLFLLLAGCDDRQVFEPATLAVVRFDADPAQRGDSVSVYGSGRTADEVDLNVYGPWGSDPMGHGQHPASADVLLKIDPASGAELVADMGGEWCHGHAGFVSSTGNLGEWRIQRAPASGDCSCGHPTPWDDYDPFRIATLHLKIHTPGNWRVEVVPASATPVCECERGCFSGLAFLGGTVKAPAP